MPRTLMTTSRAWLPWGALLVTVAVVEGIVRFAMPFSLRRVLLVEAVLFLFASGLTFRLRQRGAAVPGWPAWLTWALGWSLALGGVRAALWAAGLAVEVANLVLVGLAAIILAERLRRRGRRGDGPGPTASP